MAVDFNTAAQAYSNAVKQGGAQAGGEGAQAAGGGPSFAELVQQGMEQAQSVGQNAEQVSQQALAGEAGLTEVVTAMNNAEVTLKTVTTVRDRLVSAYQDIKNMPL